MKTFRGFVLAAFVAAAFTACQSMTATYDRYAKVYINMPRSEVVALLGAPQKDDGKNCSWETRLDEDHSLALNVRFDDRDAVVWSSIRRSWRDTVVVRQTGDAFLTKLQGDSRSGTGRALLNTSYLDAVNGTNQQAPR